MSWEAGIFRVCLWFEIRVSAKEDFSVLGIPLSELSNSAGACRSGTNIEKPKGIKGLLASVFRHRKKVNQTQRWLDSPNRP